MNRIVGKLQVKETTDYSGTKSLSWSYTWDKISKKNVQNLVNRIEEMTKSGADYWKEKTIENKQEKPINGKGKEKVYPMESLSGSGITTLKI
ncbi:MAG: hypothetical protein JNN29_03345 [Chitinophagaceae bacterium]|nr:hypothetical protein [Chitinophagaceae bacterium]